MRAEITINALMLSLSLNSTGSSLRRAFPVDLSSFTDQEIYDLNREVVDQEESFEPYEPSLFPVYQKLVDDTNIYDVLKSPAIEHVKSRKIAFSLEQPQARPPFDRITQISDAHDVSKRPSASRYIPRRACSSTSVFNRYAYLLDEHGVKVHIDPPKYFWVTECDPEPGAECLGLGPAYNSPISSLCEQKYSWINVHGVKNGVTGDYWVYIQSCCSCAVILPHL
ncbi:hypothetical protein BSL78_16225 [Apostichopus japonicus]|uniref:Spaetzle domain-containing protein n=1 Tax=Stichopus japonicus TaxID=307972 RepID=A0A2G8KG40_STIJA|nr:hypothetical protein BSL78_16225 [Apostichopus japonicus]